MAYTPRPCTTQSCAYCQQVFAARHARRRYCSHSCNVRASYARTGRRGARLAAPGFPAPPALEQARCHPVASPTPCLPPTGRTTTPVGDSWLLDLCQLVIQAAARRVTEQAAYQQLVDQLLAAEPTRGDPPK